MAMRVMHCLTMKFCTVFSRRLAVVPVRTDRCFPDTYPNLRARLEARRKEKAAGNRRRPRYFSFFMAYLCW